MRRAVPVRLTVAALAVTSLIAVPLAEAGSAAKAPVSCNNPKSVTNIKKGTSTITLSGCTNPKATGGKGTAVVNFKAVGQNSTVKGKITWNKTGTTTFQLSTKPGPKKNKCPKAYPAMFVTTGKVTGGTGAALKAIPKGSPYSESVCANVTTGKTVIVPGTKVLI